MTLSEKIQAKSAVVGVVGLGYVGLPLAVEFAHAGFHVVGIDLNEQKVARAIPMWATFRRPCWLRWWSRVC